MTATPITDDAQWHALRAKTVGGSEIAALFGLSPYETAFTLWHAKNGSAPAGVREENDYMRWGKLLEPLVASETAKRMNWQITPSRVYYQHDKYRLGATLDFDAVADPQWGPGILETKCVYDYADFKQEWSDERAPPHIELQVQAQLAVTGLAWCGIALWVAQTCALQPILIRRPNEKVIAEIEKRVDAFWKSIAAKEPPPATGTEAEFDIMKHLWPARAPLKVIENDDPELTSVVQLYDWATKQEPFVKETRSHNKALIMGHAKDAELLKVPGWDVRVKQAKNKAITLDVRENANNGIVARAPEPSTMKAG